ncbi:hypothetical protein [Streptomyces sp. NPDC056937]|uniref:hypothetical protein n=1 Tax=Streptomyces sp. NPDC056937 TaxID=3345969 RepID=UPI003645A19B
MPDLPSPSRSRTGKDYEPYSLIDTLLDTDDDDAVGRPVSRASVEISVIGVRARSESKTGLAVLKAMRREHPVLVHGLYTYLSVMGLLLALTAATAVRG